jgi:hypothetical protein
MANPAPVAIHNRSRWAQKPRYRVKPRNEWMARGLHFLCLYNSRLPVDLARQQRSAVVANTLAAVTNSPFGKALRNAPYSHGIEFSNADGYYDQLVGPVSGVARAWVNGSYYYPGLFGMSGSDWSKNVPIGFGCNQYYNGTGGIMPGITRSSASATRVWDMTYPTTDAIANKTWFTVGFVTGPLMEDVPVFFFENRRSLGAAGNYTGSGTPTGANKPVSVGQSDHGDSITDYTAMFSQKLTELEMRTIMLLPFAELVEPDPEKSYMFVPSGVAARIQSLSLLGVGD